MVKLVKNVANPWSLNGAKMVDSWPAQDFQRVKMPAPWNHPLLAKTGKKKLLKIMGNVRSVSRPLSSEMVDMESFMLAQPIPNASLQNHLQY